MRHLVGMLNSDWRQHGRATPVVLNTEQLINGHMLIAGMSGTGKSYQIQSLLRSCARERIEVDVFDSHEELLDESPQMRGICVAAKFSAATRLGYNPLELHTDAHSGGVYAQIDDLIDTLERASRKFGNRQESALRNLLLEVYALRGIYPDNPRTWFRESITEEIYERMLAARDYAGLKRYYPTLNDAISYGQRKLKALRVGTDNRAITALERVESSVAKLYNLTSKGKAITDDELKRLENQINTERDKAMDAYAEFLQSMTTGRETQDVSRYSNADTLISLIERLEMLQQSGIFRANPPDWGSATTRVYQIGSLRDEPRNALVYSRLANILRKCMDAGKTDRLRHIALLDEGHLYFSEDKDNPINRIAKEGRKYGLGLVIGSQSPHHFSEDFLTNCGTVLLTGIHENFWAQAAKMLRVDHSVLTTTASKAVVALKMQRNGESSSKFINVNVAQDVVIEGVRRISAQATPA